MKQHNLTNSEKPSGGATTRPLTIAVASGKGGTGKTTLAVQLASVAPGPVRLLDCDVEEPNTHLFLRPEIERSTDVNVPVPQVDTERCTACGACSRLCRYHAIVSLKTEPLVFPELCHGCGGCRLVCPTEAIREVPRAVGTIESGRCGELEYVQGRLRIGEAMAPPLIREVRKHAHPTGLTLIDGPPGTSCPMLAAVKGVDCVLLVTEPTPFGLHDLELAIAAIREMGLPAGVIINRHGVGHAPVDEVCDAAGLPVLLRIPDDRRVAEAYSRGELALDALPNLRPLLMDLLAQVMQRVKRPRTAAAA